MVVIVSVRKGVGVGGLKITRIPHAFVQAEAEEEADEDP